MAHGGDEEIEELHLNRLLQSLRNPDPCGRARFDRVSVEGLYAKLAELLSPDNKKHGVKSVNGVAYCTFNQEDTTNHVGWIESWSVAKDLHMTDKKEGISMIYASPRRLNGWERRAAGFLAGGLVPCQVSPGLPADDMLQKMLFDNRIDCDDVFEDPCTSPSQARV